MKPNTVTLGEVRLSYCNLFQAKPPHNAPNGDPKFSTTVLLPKSNTAAKAVLDSAVQYAIEQGVANKWGGVRPAMIPVCVHDGDGPRPSDGEPFGAECRGMWVFTASSKADKPPFVRDRNVQPVLQQSEIYSGVFGNVNVSFYAYNNGGKKGIGCGLNGFQKVRDGEAFGGSVSASEAFAPVPAAPTYAAPAAGAPTYTPPVAAAPVYTPPVVQSGWTVDPITGAPLQTT